MPVVVCCSPVSTDEIFVAEEWGDPSLCHYGTLTYDAMPGHGNLGEVLILGSDVDVFELLVELTSSYALPDTL